MFKKDPSANLLLVAPSNSAADQLALRMLATTPKTTLLRVNAYQRHLQDLPDSLKVCADGREVVGVLSVDPGPLSSNLDPGPWPHTPPCITPGPRTLASYPCMHYA